MATAPRTAVVLIVAFGVLSAVGTLGCRDEAPTAPESNLSHSVAPNASVFPSYVSTTGIPYLRARSEGDVTRAGSLLDMNEAGWAVGSVRRGQQLMAVAVNLRTGDTDSIGSSLSDASQAKAINARGAVVGGAVVVQQQPSTAFLWRDGVLTLLGSGSAMDVNAAGVVVGYSRDGTLTYPWIWHGGAIERLGTASGRANAINNRGDIVGTADVDGAGLEVPVIWRNGTPLSLQVSRSGEATNLNERGQVVGSAVGPRGTEAFLWEEGSITWLGTLPGGGQSAATAINDRGDIVGTVLLGQGLRAVMWRKGQIVDLGLSGVTVPFENVSEAFGITNSGQVIGRVGQGSARNGVVWTPPPR